MRPEISGRARKLSDPLVQVYAHLTAHELALEVMMASWLAVSDEEAAERFLVDFIDRSIVTLSTDSTAPDGSLDELRRESAAMLESFAAKVRQRIYEIREQSQSRRQ